MYVLEHPTAKYAGLIFLAQPRTASTTISMELLRRGAKRIGGHHEYTDLALLDSYYVVTGVRDHLTAVPSFFGRELKQRRPIPGTQIEITKDVTLDQYVEGFLKAHTWVRRGRLYWRYLWMADYIYRYETLVEDWHLICETMNMDDMELSKHYQKSEHPELTEDLKRRVHGHFRREREELGYAPPDTH